MADSEPESQLRTTTTTKKKTMKRKLRSAEKGSSEQRPSKAPRLHRSEKKKKERKEPIQEVVPEQGEPVGNIQDGHPWRNLQLILSLQNKDIDILRKVELAFGYVKSKEHKQGDGNTERLEAISNPRVMVFLSNWVQSLLISSEKKIRAEGYSPQSVLAGSCLDYRSWEIFRYCLESSCKMQVSLNVSRDFLRVIHFIARDAWSKLNVVSNLEGPILNGIDYELYRIVVSCVSLVFSSHCGILNENLDLWIMTVDTVLELVKNIFYQNLEDGNASSLFLQFSCAVLEPFVKFLRVHPTRKSGFSDFIDKLLEPLLHLLGVLHLHVDGSYYGWTRNLLKLIKEVFCYGLFHPAHMDGFLSLQSTGKYVTLDDGKPRDSKIIIKSYHRHFFDKLEKVLAGKNKSASSGVGDMFHLFVSSVKCQKGASGWESLKHLENDFVGHMPNKSEDNFNIVSEKSHGSTCLKAETRKSLIDFFVQIMEPLLQVLNIYIQAELEVGPGLFDVRDTLNSMSKILASFVQDKLYIRNEDISEGASFNFLKGVYDMVLSSLQKILQLRQSMGDGDKITKLGIFSSVASELVIAVRHLVEIEYKVLGNDLECLWFMMFSFASLSLSLPDSLDQRKLISEILSLGCRLVNLYSELRQVNDVIWALCKALRRLVPHAGYGAMINTNAPLLPHAKSVSLVLCSEEFRLAIRGAIGSIPEGQVSRCVQQLKTDISESLEWVKATHSLSAQNELAKLDPHSSRLYVDVQAELLGRCLSEMHTLVLDSLTVTSGNSNLISVSVKDLMTVLRPSMNSLVAVQPDGVNEFIFTFTGKKLSDSGNGCINYVLSTRWILLFFFRLYLSCRSLYRQALSLVGPDKSRKMSELMGDSLTGHAGKDWLERTDWISEGYFSWIFQPSASLSTILQSVSDFYLEGNMADCAPLIYVLNTMAIQRLVDLNRLIKSFEYLLQRKEYLKLMNDGGLSPGSKNSKKLKKYSRCLRQEAADLSNFVMGYLPFVAKDQMSNFSRDDVTSKTLDGQALCQYDKWDLEIGAVNENSLPSALWWLICHSIDVWCPHAAKKKLKMFVSLLFQSSLLRVGGSSDDLTKQKSDAHGKNITARQISLELLRDTVLYEQTFVRRVMGSRFCRTLEKSILSIVADVGEIDLKSSPNLLEVSRVCGNSSTFSSSKRYVMNDSTKVSEPISSSFERPPSFLSHNVGFTDCQNLLSFLCWMPKACLDSKSFSLCATYILNIERLVVGSLLDCHGALYSQNVSELFKLILSCRRALKSLTVASWEEKMGSSQSSLALTIFQSSSIIWLLESLSAVILPQHAASEDSATQEIAFSLMDHTSYLFLTLSKFQFIHADRLPMNVEKHCEEENNCSVIAKGRPSVLKGIDAWKTLVLIAETLKERMKRELVSRKGPYDAKMQVPLSFLDLMNLSSIISCSQGFMWGLVAALNHVDINSRKVKAKLSRQKHEPMDKLICCIDVFAEFVNYFVGALVMEDGQLPVNFCNGQNLPMSASNDDLLGAKESIFYEKENQNCGAVKCSASSSANKDCSDKSDWQKSFHSENEDFGDSTLAKCDSFDLCSLNKSMLNGFLRGQNLEAAFFLRQLFIASSALLRLNLQIKCASLSISSVPIFVGISQILLAEFANKVEVPSPLALVCLDGVVKYLEEIGSHFDLTNPTLSRNLYVKMVELHLGAIGKCIVLQGKRASLAFHDAESSAKTLSDRMGLSEYTLSCGPYYLDELKARLRTSFKGFVKKASELHLLDAIQSLERALVGVRLGCTTNYEICTGSSDGGKVSSIVAAGIDCTDLVLEFVTGRKHSSAVKSHVPSLVACLFNIILHLQGPSIFYGNITCKGDADPDPGSVILMCVEVLTKVFGKHAVYQLDSLQVGQSLRIPAALFQNFFQLRISEAPFAESAPNSLMSLDGQDTEIVDVMSSRVVDRRFLIDLFAACCRLLSTVLKHYKRETEHCVALLEDSASVLLHCLETVDPTVVGKCSFTWEVPEAVKCASFLRRIYEEMRQQKDVFGQHCSLFLSNYIWTYSGCGPLKTGIRREVDEALRPGVYALIDACSVDDLQRLHTIFGEGPCRSTLATLQHDYKLNFQYEGKV